MTKRATKFKVGDRVRLTMSAKRFLSHLQRHMRIGAGTVCGTRSAGNIVSVRFPGAPSKPKDLHYTYLEHVR